jgi:ubiquinone/menaquinone biosynthesis C-methylase UbiE
MTCSESDPPAEAGEAVRRFYRTHARFYDLTRWLTLRSRRKAVAALELRPGETVLDLGCGTGLGFSMLRRGVGPEGRVIGVDFSREMLHRARLRIDRGRWSNVETVESDLSSMVLPRRADAAAFLYSLSMVDEWELALAEAATHLTTRGRLVVLDFGMLRAGSGISERYVRWLRRNHTDPSRPYASQLRKLFGEVSETAAFRGYCRITLARCPAP